jgi:hypothetical protein
MDEEKLTQTLKQIHKFETFERGDWMRNKERSMIIVCRMWGFHSGGYGSF